MSDRAEGGRRKRQEIKAQGEGELKRDEKDEGERKKEEKYNVKEVPKGLDMDWGGNQDGPGKSFNDLKQASFVEEPQLRNFQLSYGDILRIVRGEGCRHGRIRLEA